MMPTALTPTQEKRIERARLVTEAQIDQAKELINKAFPQASDRPMLMAAALQALAINYLAEVTKSK